MDVSYLQLDQQSSAFPGISSLAHSHFQTPVAPGVGGGTTTGNESPFQLPENWIKHWSEKKKEYYYFNIRTKESRWTPPEKKVESQPRSALKRSTEELSTPSSSSPKRRVYTPPPLTPPPSPSPVQTNLSSPLPSPLPSPINSPLVAHSTNGVSEFLSKKSSHLTNLAQGNPVIPSTPTTPVLLTSGQRARETLITAERILKVHHPFSFGQRFVWEEKEDTPEQAVSRRSEVQRLQGLLRNLSRAQGLTQEPAGSFQRWSFVQLLIGPALDPLIPSAAEEDSGLLQELTGSGLPLPKAKEIAIKLAEAASASANQLNETRNSPTPSQEEEVAVVPYWDQIRVQWNRTALYLNRKHYERLQALYSKHCGEMDKFKRRLFSLLTRYEALGGPGYQAATPSPVLEALKEKLGLSHECFASPLNCRLSSYGSAFYDTDRFFGSSGSFFHSFSPSSGSFQANPPFVEEVMMAMALKLIQLLERSETNFEPMSFVVIVPGWRDTPSYLSLSSSRFLRKEIQLEKYQHAYHDGFQHRSAKNYRVADCVTIVFFLQNSKGAEKWPVTEELLLSVRNGFASNDSNANL